MPAVWDCHFKVLQMGIIPKCILETAERLALLPGIGPRTAQRLTFFLLKRPDILNQSLAGSIGNLGDALKKCETCQNFTENSPCEICTDPTRDQMELCIVESPLDAFNIENTSYNGLYHILHGTISPIDGITPKQLQLDKLFDRILVIAQKDKVEIILATNPTMEGENTALYIHNHLKKHKNISITRLARGLPMGSDVEYVDEITLQKAFEGRQNI